MGCSTSKIENEEVVSRCNARRRSVRDAVAARHALAAAFSGYVIALRTAGSAFSQYGDAEFREPAELGTAATTATSAATPSPFVSSKPRPPPPPPSSASVASAGGAAAAHSASPPPPAVTEPPSLAPLKRTVSAPPIPISEPKKKSGGGGKAARSKKKDPLEIPAAVEDEAAAPSEEEAAPQSEEEAPPPTPPPQSPPKKAEEWTAAMAQPQPPPPPPMPSNQPPPPPPPPSLAGSYLSELFVGLNNPIVDAGADDDEEDERKRAARAAAAAAAERRRQQAEQQQRREQEEREEQRQREEQEQLRLKQQEQMKRKPSTVEEGDELESDGSIDEGEEGVGGLEDDEDGDGEAYTEEEATEAVGEEAVGEEAAPPTPVNLDLPKTDLAIVTTRPGMELVQVMKKIDELFYDAYESGREVASMLEAQRASFHKNYIDEKSHENLNHADKVLRAISWSQGSFPAKEVQPKQEEEEQDMEISSHASTLDRLLAWEKKLYEEIKRAESIRIEIDKKNRDDGRGGGSQEALQALQTRFVVALQGVETARSSVLRLRDKELYHQLIELLEGLKVMWKRIHGCHSEQQRLVNGMKKLQQAEATESTTAFQKIATEQLVAALRRWHEFFGKVVHSERHFMRQLNAYVRISIMPLEHYGDKEEQAQQTLQTQTAPVARLCHEWQQALDRLPDQNALDPIRHFVAAMEQIAAMQAEEVKLRKRVDNYVAERQRKQEEVDKYERKHLREYRSRGGGGGGGAVAAPPPGEVEEVVVGPLTEKRAQLEVLRKRTEDERGKAEVMARDMRTRTMVNLETGLPSVFQTVTHYSRMCSDAHDSIRLVC